MTDHFIVCHYNSCHLTGLRNKSAVFNIDTMSDLEEVKNAARTNNIHIHCIRFKSKKALSEIIFRKEWSGIPIAMEAPALGRVSIFLRMAQIIKNLNIRFYFSTDSKSCYQDVRILSSLGYHCAVIINGSSVNWEELTDLMTYALLNRIEHQEIHPFDYVVRYYHPQNRTDYNAVYFNDAARYIYLSDEGVLSLSPDSKDSDCKISEDLKSIDNISETQVYKDYSYRWHKFFLKPTECASCSGWRICLGKYEAYIKQNPGCKLFFSEFLDSVEIRLKNKETDNKEKPIWQP